MEFWRTLFKRNHLSSRPTQQVTPILPAIPYVPLVPAPLPTFQTLVFSATSFARGTPSSGTISNATAGSVIVAVGLPSGLTINSAARTWTWSGASASSSGSFALYENIPGSAGNPSLSTISFTISGSLTTLATLSLSATTFTRGTTASGTIIGATALSTITAASLPSGLTIDGAARTWAWDGTGTGAASGSITLTETLAGASNTPNSTVIGYTINAAGSGGQLLFNAPAQSGLLVLLEDI